MNNHGRARLSSARRKAERNTTGAEDSHALPNDWFMGS